MLDSAVWMERGFVIEADGDFWYWCVMLKLFWRPLLIFFEEDISAAAVAGIR